jgi:hypothetical protein
MVWSIMDVLCEWTQLVILLVVEVVAVAVGEEDMVVVVDTVVGLVDAVVGLVDAVVVVEVIVVSCLHYIRHLRLFLNLVVVLPLEITM